MTFTDRIQQSSKLFRSCSMSNQLNTKESHRKLKQLNASILNFFPRHRPMKNLETTNDQVQQANALLQPSSIMTTSELSRSISNKSITFASVFDETESPTVSLIDRLLPTSYSISLQGF